MTGFISYFLAIVLMSGTVCWAAGSNYETTDFGNKLNYVEPKCLRRLNEEIGANSSRMVTLQLIEKLGEIANKAGEVGRNSILDGTTHLGPEGIQRISDEVASYIVTSYKTLDLKDYLKIIGHNVLNRLCHIFNCCYSS